MVPAALLVATLLPATAEAIVRPDQLRARGRLERPDGRVWDVSRELVPGAKGARARLKADLETRVGLVQVWSDPAQSAFARVLFLDAPRLPGATGSTDEAFAALIRAVELLPGLMEPALRGADLRVVHDRRDGARRDLALGLYVDGVAVIGASLSASFFHGRLVAVRNDLPATLERIGSGTQGALIGDASASAGALSWMQSQRLEEAKQRGLSMQAVDAFGVEVLPGAQWLVARDGVRHRGLIKVRTAIVSAHRPASAWRVYLDANTGEAVAREPLLIFDQANARFSVPERSPMFGSQEYVASGQNLVVDGVQQQSDAQGNFEIGQAPKGSLVEVLPSSAEVTVTSQSPGSDFGTVTLVPPTSAVVWGSNDEEFSGAVAATLVHGAIVQQWVRPLVPELEWVNTPLVATVNIDDQCNAYSDGDGIFFFRASDACENTGRIADVIYHEYGHSIHTQSLIPGIGQFDSALSEGISDYLAATITNDAGMARGFFYTDEPLRDLDPVGLEYKWPDDIGEVHYEGQIIAGALWDLRKSLIEKHGFEEGRAITDRLWMESIRRATGLLSMYPEALLADDDDGTLANGTPNACLIREAFALHGLYQADVEFSPASLLPAESPQEVSVTVGEGIPGCSESLTATLWFKPRGASDAEAQSIAMTANGSVHTASLPAQAAGTVLNYAVVLNFASGGSQRLPGNIADRWYEVYFGPTTPIYCTSFESAVDLADWNLQGFESGAPAGLAGDPDAATDGGAVLGVNLQGAYNPAAVYSAVSPVIATEGWSNVRLQYQRWLEVEDGIFDTAGIRVDGELAWQNYAAGDDDVNTHTHHRDGEWRFHDLDLSSTAQDGSVQVRFELQSDGGLEFGGWNIDEFCIVGTQPIACGDGVVAGVEECDDGNGNSDGAADACRTNCTLPTCGDGVVDSGEQCDGDEDCSDDCTIMGTTGEEPEDDFQLRERGCGPCSSGDRKDLPVGAVGLSLLVLLRLRASRRRRRGSECGSRPVSRPSRSAVLTR